MVDQVAPFVAAHQRAGIVVQDSMGRIVDFNAAALDVLALSADELRGRRSIDPAWQAVDRLLAPIPGERHPAMRVLADGVALTGEVLGVRVGGGAYRWLSVDAWPYDVDGHGGVVCQFTDVTNTLAARAELVGALERLQRHALPSRDIDIPGITVHVRYRNAAAALEVGGDFLDVFAVSDERFKFFIGDASGHDLDTVATTIVAHHTLRAASLHLKRPGRVLTWLHDTLLATPDTVFCSAIQGTLTLGKRRTLRFANAGHPAPILVRDGSVRVFDEHGMIIGALDSFSEPPEVTIDLRSGDQLLLYTDGLIESLQPRMSPEHLAARCGRAGHEGMPVIDLVDDLISSAIVDEDTLDDIAALVFVVE